MYVRWKVLTGLGIVFWISLCVFDSYWIDPKTKRFYFSPKDQLKWKEELEQYEKLKLAEHNLNFGLSLLFWNLVTFLVTLLACSAIKYSLYMVTDLKERFGTGDERCSSSVIDLNVDDTYDAIETRRKNFSKIPVRLPSQTHLENEERFRNLADMCCTVSNTNVDVKIRPSKSDISHCNDKEAKQLRCAMLSQQTESLKEHAALSRRLEMVSREKRDLCRQLMALQKENRSARHQLEELIDEKQLLVKRLDCASREFWVNSKAKKAAISKLDEALETIADLKRRLELANREKDILENRIKNLDSQHEIADHLFRCMSQHELNESPDKKTDAQNNSSTDDTGKKTKEQYETDVSQSQRDVEKVQKRLSNVEKSLNKLKLSNYTSTYREEVDAVSNASNLRGEGIVLGRINSRTSFVETRTSGPVTESLFLSHDNLTDEQRRKILQPGESSGDDISNASKNIDSSIGDPLDRVGNVLNYMKCFAGSVERERLLESTTDETPAYSGESEDNYWGSSSDFGKRIVSNSPAFQEFLKRMDSNLIKDQSTP